MSSGRPEPPRIVVLTTGPEHLLRAVAAGLAEEGAAYELLPGPPVSATELALRAAARSGLEVGVGLDAAGSIAVHRHGLPGAQPVSLSVEPTAQAARRAGRDAARRATGRSSATHESA